jgi:flagellar biosynthetic protein FliQ
MSKSICWRKINLQAALERQSGHKGREVSSDQAIQLFSQLMWNAALIAAPLLLTTLAVGLLVSVFQAVTQIQEMSLTFIPKLLATGIVLVVAGPWMLGRLMAYSQSLIAGIPRYF